MSKAPARVTLPGSLYQKNGRWWWKVDLPGEDKPTARPLKPDGSRCATTDYQEAEEIARDMWRLAVEAEAQARITAKAMSKAEKANEKIRAEAAEAIEKAQAECEKKIKKSKRALARAENKAKVQAEARLRAEEGYKAQTEQAEKYYAGEIAKIKQTIDKVKVEFEEKDRAYKEALAEAEEKVRTEAMARQEAESKAKEEVALREQAEQRAESEAMARAAKLNEALEGMERTGTCECCGRKDVPENDLAKIDSGQQLCPDCIGMLRG
jgi:hypothetical protein